MNDLNKKMATLSDEQRELFYLLLKEEGLDVRAFPIVRREGSGPTPLSFTQERIWSLWQMAPDIPTENAGLAYVMKGRVRTDILQDAINEVVRRHEILRTLCAQENGQVIQNVTPELTLNLNEKDLRDLPSSERQAEAIKKGAEEIRRPFDLTREHLLRASIYRMDEEEYVLVITTHQFVADGWSTDILLREISLFYNAGAMGNGKGSPLPEPSVQYGDLAVWQRQWLSRGALKNSVLFWKKQLDGVPIFQDFPTDRPRPSVPTFRGSIQTFELSKKLSDDIKALSLSQGITLFVTILTAFKTFLHRYSHQRDLVVATSTSARTQAELENSIGNFANTLMLRINFSDDPTFAELLEQVNNTVLDSFTHQELPLEKLIAEVDSATGASRIPSLQFGFIFRDITSGQEMEFLGIELKKIHVDLGTARPDLWLDMTHEPEAITGLLQYRTDLFDRSTIQRMLGHFQKLLEGIVEDPNRRVSELSLMAEEERDQILNVWNKTSLKLPKEKGIHDLFEAQAKMNPSALAVVFGKNRLSYSELNNHANHLADNLQALGVKPGDRVVMETTHSTNMLVGILGILKAGGVFVPLDPESPTEWLKGILKNAAPSVLVGSKSFTQKLKEFTNPVVHLEEMSFTNTENPSASIDNSSHAVMTYGLTPTGHCVGIPISHGTLINLVLGLNESLEVSNRDVFLAISPKASDIALLEMIYPLAMGASLVLVDEEAEQDSRKLADIVISCQITFLPCVPEVESIIRVKDWKGNSGLNLLCSEEAPQEDTVKKIDATGGKTWKLYGHPETAGCSVVKRIFPEDSSNILGKPMPNTQIYFLDSCRNPVPIGVSGEVYIGGKGVASGYWNNEEMSRGRFVPNPFEDDSESKLFKTGDLARLHSDGRIEYQHQLNGPVKHRGFKFDPEGIGKILQDHEAVRQALVLVGERKGGVRQLMAYLILENGREATSTELRKFLQQRFPAHMIPQYFFSLDEFPRTSAGSIDFLNLPEFHDTDGAAGEENFLAPRNDMEKTLANIWQEALGVCQVGVHDNFFDLGGHSLLSIQVMDRIEKEIGVRLNMRIMLLNTLGQTAPLCEEQASPAKTVEKTAMNKTASTEGGPIGKIIRRFLQQRTP